VEAVRRTYTDLEGHFSFVAMHREDPDTLVGARRECPLVVGVGDGERFLASDVSAFLSETRRVQWIENGELVVIRPGETLVLQPDGTPCGPGEEGELVHRGALVAQGYWGDAARTAERFRPIPGGPDWRAPELAVWSGDRVVADEEGFLYFVGRTDDMIKTSGYRVSPTEIEEVAYDSGLVRDAAALGLPDEALGHRVVVVVSPAVEGFEPDALLAVFRRQLPRYMVPAEVIVRTELPRSPNGKFDRVLLREELTTTPRRSSPPFRSPGQRRGDPA
jgi:acyl-CoA synthetase (AMP-forming)/AMP-acid ligase II